MVGTILWWISMGMLWIGVIPLALKGCIKPKLRWWEQPSRILLALKCLTFVGFFGLVGLLSSSESITEFLHWLAFIIPYSVLLFGDWKLRARKVNRMVDE